jgi:hypothetical protein
MTTENNSITYTQTENIFLKLIVRLILFFYLAKWTLNVSSRANKKVPEPHHCSCTFLLFFRIFNLYCILHRSQKQTFFCNLHTFCSSLVQTHYTSHHSNIKVILYCLKIGLKTEETIGLWCCRINLSGNK